MKSALDKPGFMIVLSSPSGAGKTTIANALLKRNSNIVSSISATTRAQRGKEVDGKDYFFTKKDDFQTMIDQDQLLEYALVYGNYYGTPRKMVADSLAQGKDVLFDIDWQGTQQLRLKKRGQMVSIFVLPPTIEILRKRLEARQTDTADVIDARMQQAVDEISHASEYDYIVVNHDLNETIDVVDSIVKAEKHRKSRAHLLPDYLRMRKEEML